VSGSVEKTGTPGEAKRITSLANPQVKEIRGLALAKNRKASGLFVAEGLKLVADALECGWTIRTLVHSDRVANEALVRRLSTRSEESGGQVLTVSEAVLGKITRRDNPQTVVGVFEQRLTPLDDIRPAGDDLWVGLEAVRDPGNLGTILRTIDAVGASGAILVGETVDPFSPEAVRATMGSVFHVGLARAGLPDVEKLCADWPGTVVGTHLAGTLDYRNADYRRPVLLVMGREQSGLSPALADACNTLVKIPMAGRADSLNLAVATGIMLFEIARDRLKLDG
jgi:TrmH family RNA methyltransferase